MIGIIDVGIGNLGSIRNMFKKIGAPAKVVSDAAGIAAAAKLVLPGVGAFDAGMARLHGSGLLPVIEQRAFEERIPVLGICLGMQLMTHGSEEGRSPGLGWIPARTLRFPIDSQPRLRVPHMGWNHVRVVRLDPLIEGVDGESAFYFVHSFHIQCEEPEHVLLSAEYGIKFVAAFRKNNLLGVQFHPEKSHRHGMQVLGNFARMAA
jgi:glutamine amidotransferase